jgi:glycosyltransferase involved in cell wall biosynthesis
MQFKAETAAHCLGVVDREDEVDFACQKSESGSKLHPGNPYSVRSLPAAESKPQLNRPLRVMFMQTDMRVGGAEMVTANIIRKLDQNRFLPELCCLKELGEIGETLRGEIPLYSDLLRSKYDLRVLPRLVSLLRRRKIDAVVTVGAGDKMFWGRIAARRLGLPVVIAALHTTGWPDGVGRLNRMLTPFTDAFVAVAASHGEYLIEHERFPAPRVVVIPNGVDTEKFTPHCKTVRVRNELGIHADAPVVGIVAALRPEKNHELFLEMARRVLRQLPNARFLVVGDGLCRRDLERRAVEMGLRPSVKFLGLRNDVPRILAAMDVFALTSHNEANPMSILEAMSVGVPVVATDVGSIHEAVIDGDTGFLVPAGDSVRLTESLLGLLMDPQRRAAMGAAARTAVLERWSIDAMVSGYERLIESIYHRKMSALSPQLSVAHTTPSGR